LRAAQVAFGVATYIPGVLRIPRRWKGTGGTDSARYCYSVWLRHLVMAHANGLTIGIPASVAELGPGDSLGIGIAALMSGVETYHGLDVARFANFRRNLAIFDELAELFRAAAEIPDASEFPEVKPRLQSYAFPASIVSTQIRERALEPERLRRLRQFLATPDDSTSAIRYFAPWHRADVVRPGAVDMIFSQAVLEHVDDLPGAYRAMRTWLREGGFVSHQIDFRCHGTANEWNGHWTYPDWAWTLLRGKRPYLLNREPCSAHLALLRKCDFDVVCKQVVTTPSRLARVQLASRFQRLEEEDLTTSGAFIQARAVRAARERGAK
jgi:SAM-dependent methyltransferase